MTDPRHDELDPFLEEILDGAMAPFVGRLPVEQLARLRCVLREEMREDATAMRLLSAARPRTAPLRSGDLPAENGSPGEAAAAAARVVPFRRRNSA